ncbi:MAG: BON domain-containing protein [Steroidobacteraceae bacterium]
MKNKILAATLASLVVSGFAVGPTAMAAETVGGKIDDASLVARIKADLLRSPQVDGLDVNVDAKNGVITLSGTAATDAERVRAEQIAKTATGVKGVDNKIVVKPDKK